MRSSFSILCAMEFRKMDCAIMYVSKIYWSLAQETRNSDIQWRKYDIWNIFGVVQIDIPSLFGLYIFLQDEFEGEVCSIEK